MTWAGGDFGERARCVLAPNPDMMTLDGTNTWVLREPGARRPWSSTRARRSPSTSTRSPTYAGDVAVVLLTHGHLDHSEAARSFAERVGLRRARARPAAPARRRGARRRRRGRGRRPRGARGRHARATPRTRCRSCCPPSARCSPATPCSAGVRRSSRTPTASSAPTSTRCTGCTRSPRRRRSRAVWPGHGPVIDDALAALDFYLAHRQERLEQVREALRGARGAGAGPTRTTYRGRSSRRCTPTSTRCSGAPPSSASAPSSTTSRG